MEVKSSNFVNLYSIKDIVAEEHGPPWIAKNEAVSVRQFKQLIKNQNYNERDYVLVQLGVFDTESGKIVSDYRVVDMFLHIEIVKEPEVEK